jgi:hypothetical protein
MDKDKIENPIWNTEQATNASAKQVGEYIQARINDYEEDDISGDDLFDMWKGDFVGFITTTFSKTKEATKALRDFLRANGVYIKKSRRLIAEELFDTLQRHEPEIWPANDKDRPSWLTNQTNQEAIQRPSRQPTQEPQGRPQNNQYNLVNLSKLYTDEQKYSGDSDNFDFKYSMFLDLCERTEAREAYLKAFPALF